MNLNVFVLWFIHACVLLLIVHFVSRKYGTILNPVSFYGGFYLVASAVVPALFYLVGLLPFTDESIRLATYLSTLFFVALGLAFWISSSPFKRFFSWMIDRFTPSAFSQQSDVTAGTVVFEFAQFVALYLLLMVLSGVGTKWLTASREAYQYDRASVGLWWSLSEAALLLAYLCVLFRSGKTPLRVFAFAVLFAFCAVFLGSKASTLAYFVIAVFFVHFKIKPVRNWIVISSAGAMLILAILLQLFQGTSSTLLDAVLYFDYFNYSVFVLQELPDRGWQYGAITLSNIWFYVPRAIYPLKPFVYGQNILTDWVAPGTAEASGFTPGLLQWVAPYADFGVLGVVLGGLWTGFLAKGAYELFLERRDLLSAILLAQLGFIYYIEIFPNAPFPIFWLWLVGQIALIRSFAFFYRHLRMLPVE